MSKIEIMFTILLSVLFVALIVLNVFQDIFIQRCKKMLDEKYTQDTELIKYCLTCILNNAVKDEDFETAKKCKTLLDSFKKLEAKN